MPLSLGVTCSGDFILWPLKHRFLDFDIGIAPLIDDYFNRCKTPIKWMEYGILETVTVCSPTLYSKVVKHGETGFIAKTEEDWVKYLSLLIEDKRLRKKIGKAARREVFKRYDLDLHWRGWVEVYEKVVGI